MLGKFKFRVCVFTQDYTVASKIVKKNMVPWRVFYVIQNNHFHVIRINILKNGILIVGFIVQNEISSKLSQKFGSYNKEIIIRKFSNILHIEVGT